MSEWCCPNCGTDTTYFSPDNPKFKSCFCTFRGEIIDAERERIITLIETNLNKWLDREGMIPDGTVLEYARLARVATLKFISALIREEEK